MRKASKLSWVGRSKSHGDCREEVRRPSCRSRVPLRRRLWLWIPGTLSRQPPPPYPPSPTWLTAPARLPRNPPIIKTAILKNKLINWNGGCSPELSLPWGPRDASGWHRDLLPQPRPALTCLLWRLRKTFSLRPQRQRMGLYFPESHEGTGGL